jgi:hypothetical protein
MSQQNIINSPNPSVWTLYPAMTVSGVTTAAGKMPVICPGGTNPTKGTASEIAYYLQIGKLLTISWVYSQATVGVVGSSYYVFVLPTGFTINTTVAVSYTNAILPYGQGTFNVGGIAGTEYLTCGVYSSGGINGFTLFNPGSNGYMGDAGGAGSLIYQYLTYTVFAQLPIN